MSSTVFSFPDVAGTALSLALWPGGAAPGLAAPPGPAAGPAWPLPPPADDPYERLLAVLAAQGTGADPVWFG